jgi:crotonobetainyl-CoA:carnitine CoA-transferase CaiB-like acyl-CoA transferase
MRPLQGIRVVDLANFLSGPILSMYLGDFGAEVVKVERPDSGDELRQWGHAKEGIGLYFKVVNRNKKSVTADLHTPLGVEIVKRLTHEADIVVENFRPGTLERWGLGYDVLSAINPGVILIRISGFGQTGPYSPRRGFGTLAEAFSGYAHINGFPDRPPLLPAFGLADATTGLNGAFLALVCLQARERTGQGQSVDLAIYEPLYTLLGPQVIDYDQLGIVQQRDGSRLPFTAPRNTYRTRDGRWVSISGTGQRVFERMCVALGRRDLTDDPRFVDNRSRLRHSAELDEAIEKAIASFDLDELLRRFDEHQTAVAPVYSVADTLEDPHYRARGNLVSLEDEELGTVRFQNVVGNLSLTPGEIDRAGPWLGEHNREILVDRLGFDPNELTASGLALDRGSVP